jgi:hypothetical protein
MSVTISKNVGPIPVMPHKPELVLATVVFNPFEGRLSVNFDNTSLDDAVTLLTRAMLILSSKTDDIVVVRKKDSQDTNSPVPEVVNG